MRLIVAAIAFSVATAPISADAVSFVYLTDFRGVGASNCNPAVCTPVFSIFPEPFEDWSFSQPLLDISVSQTSVLGDQQMTVESAISTEREDEFPGEYSRASSVFSIVFQVTEDTPYTLVGDCAFNEIELARSENGSPVELIASNGNAPTIEASGFLLAGEEYRIFAGIPLFNTLGSGPKSVITSMRLTLVPEPASALMVALGLAALARGRRPNR